jgi:hypothetical protein
MNIRLKGLNKYARERIKQHGRGETGDVFKLEQRKGDTLLVRSLEDSWRLKAGVLDNWLAWLKLGIEVEEVK